MIKMKKKKKNRRDKVNKEFFNLKLKNIVDKNIAGLCAVLI